MRRVLASIAAVTAISLPLAACGGSSTTTSSKSGSQPTVIVGSANFAENEILADIYADALRKAGVPVKTKLNIGDREIYFKELKSGALNAFPEYNGAVLEYLVPSSRASSTAAVDTALKKALPSNLEALKPSSAQDKDSITVTEAFAKAHNLKSIADLKSIESQVVMGGPPEFAHRADGIPGLKKLYGITFKSFKPLDESGPLTVKALQDGTIQAGDVFTTDPVVVKDHFVSLADPKHLFAAQNVIPIVNKKVATPKVVSTLDAISSALSTSDLVQLVNGVTYDHASVSTVASAFVTQAKLK